MIRLRVGVIRIVRAGQYPCTCRSRRTSIVHDVVDEVKDLEHEADVGTERADAVLADRRRRVFVIAVVIVLLVIAFTAYYLAK